MSTDAKDVKYFINADGKKIACRYWIPNEKARAAVLISHGAGEHSACYQQMADTMTSHGLMVFAHDHVGHGLSEGARVHINSFSEYTRDIFQHVEQVKSEHKDLDLFIIGHSMGGAIALKVCMEKPDLFKGMLLIGPAVVPNPETATTCRLMIARCVAMLWAQCPVAAIEPKFICSDPAIVDKYEKDPLVHHGSLKAKWAVELLGALSDITSHPERITTPMFVVQGTEDKLVEKSGAIFLQDNAASTDKTVQMIEGAYHQVHNEPDGVGTKCVQDMCDWITQRL